MKKFGNVKFVSSFRSIINHDWYNNFVKKYTITEWFFTSVPFIFLQSFLGMISKTSFNLIRLKKSKVAKNIYIHGNNYNYKYSLTRRVLTPTKFNRKFTYSVNNNYNRISIYNQISVTKLFEYLLQKLIEYKLQQSINMLQINKPIKSIKPDLTLNIFKLFRKSFQNEHAFKQVSTKILKNLKFGYNLFHSRLVQIENYNKNIYGHPVAADSSRTGFLLNEPNISEQKSTGNIFYRSLRGIDKLIAMKSQVHNFINLRSVEKDKNIFLKNFKSGINILDKIEAQNILYSSHLDLNETRYSTIQRKQDLISSTLRKKGIEFAHAKPIMAASHSIPINDMPKYMGTEKKEVQSTKIELKDLPEDFGQILIKSPIINRIADQVSNVLERRLFIERERRGI